MNTLQCKGVFLKYRNQLHKVCVVLLDTQVESTQRNRETQ